MQLKKLRLQNPDLYPAYFDELLQHNSIHTFDHLIQMNELNSRLEVGKAVNKMELSEITSILLETKKMMIDKVKSSLNENCKDMVFILGGTGSGKSTTWSFLKGDKMVLKWGNYESEANQNHYISHSTTNSFTFLPNIVIKDNCAMVDFPGFDDTKRTAHFIGYGTGVEIINRGISSKSLITGKYHKHRGKIRKCR